MAWTYLTDFPSSEEFVPKRIVNDFVRAMFKVYGGMNDDKPTELTAEDIDKFVEKLMTDEIKEKRCSSCDKRFFFQSYGYMFGECDECYFSRFPKEQVEAFCRSFFE
jgi:hypothetical protein